MLLTASLDAVSEQLITLLYTSWMYSQPKITWSTRRTWGRMCVNEAVREEEAAAAVEGEEEGSRHTGPSSEARKEGRMTGWRKLEEEEEGEGREGSWVGRTGDEGERERDVAGKGSGKGSTWEESLCVQVEGRSVCTRVVCFVGAAAGLEAQRVLTGNSAGPGRAADWTYL